MNELFIKTADENYVTARFCFTYGLDVDFFWEAVHALEKYLKAALLLNGRSGKSRMVGGKQKSYGNNIVDLFATVQPLAPELLPVKLTRPDGTNPARLNADVPAVAPAWVFKKARLPFRDVSTG